MSSLRNLFILLCALPLVSCGFEPVYATKAGSQNAALPVSLDPVAGRDGQIFVSRFDDLAQRGGANVSQPYGASVTIDKILIPLITRPDGTIARYNISLTAQYRLYRRSDNATLQTDSIRYFNSFNVSDIDYAQFISEKDATERGLKELAESFRLRLIGYFSKPVQP